MLEIQILIGADYLWCFQEGTSVRRKPDEPVAVHTKLGCVLSGPVKRRESGDVRVNFVRQGIRYDERESNESVQKLWDFETLGIREEEEVHEFLRDAIKFNGKRYSVSLPWKEGHQSLPCNYSISLNRLGGQLGRLKREPEILEEYDRVIKE